MIFSHFFHVICYAKSERLSWCQKRTLFRTDDFLLLILFHSVSSDSFSVRRSMRTRLFLRFVFRETSHCTYVPIWLTYACMLKKKTAFSWRNNPLIVLAADFQKDSFERSLPIWFFIVAVLRPIFAFLRKRWRPVYFVFLLGPKIIVTTVNYFRRIKKMWRFIVRPNLAQISSKKAGHVAAFFGRESSPFCRIKGMSFYLTKVREHLKRNV